MATIGQRARLKSVREQTFGMFLDGGELGEVLLPRREVPFGAVVGDEFDVFLYFDSEDRPVATRMAPHAMPGEFAYLKVVQITPVGAFLDWGLPKDLLLPFREQKEPMEVGKSYVVRLYVDEESGRIAASRRLARYLDKLPKYYVEGQEVDLIIYGKTELGYKAIVNGKHTGVLYSNEVFRKLRAGEKTRGFIVKVRDDDKLDLSLYAPGREKVKSLETRILEELEARGGSWDLCDNSPAEEIHRLLGVSKRAFKQATGALFRKKKIVIDDTGIRLLSK